jgi:hypothetical protein
MRQYHPFANLPDCERLLVLSALERPQRVHLADDNWLAGLTAILVRSGTAQLVGSLFASSRMADALVRVGVEPIDAETLLVHARLVGMAIDGRELVATFELPEAVQ